MLLRLGGIAAVVLAFTVFVVHKLTTDEIREEVESHAMSEVRGEARQLDGIVSNASLIPRFLAARQQEIGRSQPVDWTVIFRELLSAMPADEVYGIFIAYDPEIFGKPDAFLWMDRKSFPQPGRLGDEHRESAWFRDAGAERGLHITEPYFDKGGSNIPTVSVTQGVWIDDALFAIAGADLSLGRVEKMVQDIRLRLEGEKKRGPPQSAMLVSRSGKFLSHPDREFLASENRPAKTLADLPYGNRVAASAEGSLRFEERGKGRLLFWATAPLSGWKLLLDVPEDLITAPAADVATKTFLAALIGLGILLILAGMDARRIANPTRRLVGVAEQFQRGDFDTPIPDELIDRRDEIADLAGAMREMASKIRSSRERELAEWNQSLEETVRHRTSELGRAVEAAQIARREAEAANRAKSAFLANMSHELRTPLNAIIGYSEMLAEDAADAGDTGSIEDLDKIQTAGRHLLALINDVLDLSKIEADKMTVFLETIDLEAMLREIASTMHPLAEKQSNLFLMELFGPLGEMHSDSTKIRQILFNLLSNALKFTKGGRIILRVTRFAGDLGDWIRFEVRDTGIGMGRDQIERIFEAFTQADTTTTRKYGGTGLGLAISQRFSRMLGGDIRVVSEPGAGSTFTVELPCQAPSMDLPGTSEEKSPTPHP